MKKLIIIFLITFSSLFANSVKEINSKITDVTIFLKSAQIKRVKKVFVQKGETTLKFIGISQNIDKNSIKIRDDGNLSILSVQLKYVKEDSLKINYFNAKIYKLQRELLKLRKTLKINSNNINFLDDNIDISKKNSPISVKDFKESYQFYKRNIKNLIINESKLNSKIDSIENQIKFFNDSIDVINSFIEKTSGVIVVRVISNKNVKCNIELSYIVENVYWRPEYDIVVKDISKPIEIVYGAKIFQNSGVDWNNVKLKLSTIQPNSISELPKIYTYYLGYGGYKRTRYDYGEYTRRENYGLNNVYAVFESAPIEHEFLTNIEFEIPIKYSIKSRKNFSMIDIKRLKLPATYKYYTVPKFNKTAFLMANITNWQGHGFLHGDVNLYFEDIYVGKSSLGIDNAQDTLKLMLGKDKQISVKRKRIKNYIDKSFLNKNRGEIVKEFETVIHNNKSKSVDIVVYDQIPVSNNSDIVIKDVYITDKKIDKKTGVSENGKFHWDLTLQPNETKKLKIKYTIEASNLNKLHLIE